METFPGEYTRVVKASAFDPAHPQSVSVVVINWNAREELAACLASLEAQTDAEFEVIVVDNASTDGSADMVRRRHPDVRLIEAGENLGFAEGCNRGFAAARGAWVATLNNDAAAEPGWIAALRGAAQSAGARVGMLQSKILFRHDRSRTNSTGVLVFTDGRACDRDFDRPARDGESPEEIFAASAGAALYRRRMLDDVRLGTGIFDRTYFMYFEDVDLGWRARLADWTSVYVPGAVVVHAFRGSSSRRGAYFVELHCMANRLRTLAKNASLPFLCTTARRTVADVAWATRRIGPKAFPLFVGAVLDGARQRPEVSRLARQPRRAVERRWFGEWPVPMR
jgi:GT2 family glycosyltransferase